jgi:hypothetical protein
MLVKEKNLLTKGRLTTAERIEWQTRQSWATPIVAYSDVPECYQPFFSLLQQAGVAFPRAVLTPTYEGFLHNNSEKLLFAMDEKLYLLEKEDSTFSSCCFSFLDISCIEFSSVLLDSNLWFCGIDQNGTVRKEHLRFNAVSECFYKPFIRLVRKSSFPEDASVDYSFLSELEEKSLKFASFCHQSILPGEKVLKLVWQLELSLNFIHRLEPIFHHPVFPSHVVMLTDHELITIHETEPQTLNDKYGGTWDFVPLTKIESLFLTQHNDDQLKLEVKLVDDTCLQVLFLSDKLPEVEGLISLFHTVMG